jgi:hypothetical protein
VWRWPYSLSVLVAPGLSCGFSCDGERFFPAADVQPRGKLSSAGGCRRAVGGCFSVFAPMHRNFVLTILRSRGGVLALDRGRAHAREGPRRGRGACWRCTVCDGGGVPGPRPAPFHLRIDINRSSSNGNLLIRAESVRSRETAGAKHSRRRERQLLQRRFAPQQRQKRDV